MQIEETNLMHTTPTSGTHAGSEGCGENNAGQAFKQVLPFCGVKIWPKDVDATCRIQEIVSLFEKKEQHLLQISEMIREKVYARELVVSRLEGLKNIRKYKLNVSVDRKKDILAHLHMAQDKLSFANKAQRGTTSISFSTEAKLDNHKLNFRMLHKTKNLAEEKQLLTEINMSQLKDAPSTSPLAELNNILLQIQTVYDYHRYHYKPENYDRLLEEIKQFKLTGKNKESLRGSIKNQVKIICDDLMGMRKEKIELETKIKDVDKELQAINEEIWSYQTQLKERHCKKEASLFSLKEWKGFKKYYWDLNFGNLECESLHMHNISSEKWSGMVTLDLKVRYYK